MTTLTITPQPGNGALQLAVASLDTITAITRSDANGVAEVRTLPGVLPWTAERVVLKTNGSTNGWPTSATGWLTSSGYVRTYEAAGRFGRTKTMLFTKTGAGAYVVYGRRAGLAGTGTNATLPTNPSDVVPVAPGETVYAKMDFGTDTPNTLGRVTIRFFDSSYASITSSSSTQVDMQLNTWQTFSHSAVAPAGAASWWLEWAVELKTGDTVGGEKCWASRVLLGPPGDYFDGGSTDTDVYLYSYAPGGQSLATGAAGDLNLTDYEAASGAVSYTVDGAAGDLTQSITWALTDPWVFVPVMPSYSVKLKTLLEYSAGGDSLGSIHELLGRDDPVAILRGMSTRRGTLRLYCGTFAEAKALVDATRRGEVLMLRQPEHQGLDMYFTVTGYGIPTLEPDGANTVFGVDLAYVELARPEGDLAGSLGWTFAALAASQTSFAKLPKVYATFQDMLLDKRKP